MDLRVRLLTYLLAGFAALLVVAGAVVASSLRDDVQDEVEASARLVELLLSAGQPAAEGRVAGRQRLDALIAQGGLRHVQVAVERSDSEQVLHSVTAVPPSASWLTRLTGLQSWDLPVHRVPLGGGEALVIRVDPHSEVDEVLEDAASMLGVFALFAAVSMAAAWWAADRALRPVRALEEGLARIGRGERAVSLPPMALREFQQVSGAIERMAESLEQLRAGERRMGQRLMAMQESEREELARELHDEFGQGLAAMAAAAAFVERHASSAKPELLVECARDIRQASAHMGLQVRSRLRQLRPHGLQDMNMREALTELVYGSRLRAEGVVIETQLPEVLPSLPAEAGLALYRTVQEALTNVLKHAGARRVSLQIEVTGDGLCMTLDDDGGGCPKGVLQAARAGVMGMRERAAMAGGRFDVVDAPLGGVRVSLWLPVPSHSTEGGTAHGERAVAG
jgi:two-component system sensor histidine kinase UhpB